MMRKLPPCPKCSELDLWLFAGNVTLTLSCRECGWHHTFMQPENDTELNVAVADAVAKAKEASK